MRIASKWSEVSLKQYMEIADINAIDMDELDKQIKILSVLSNTSEDKLCQMSVSDLKESIRVCQFIYTEHLAGHIKQYIKIGTKKFSINTDLKKITGGEYIDLTSFIKDKKQVTKNLPQIIAIFLHPVNWFGFKKNDCYIEGCQTLASRHNTSELIECKLMMDEVMTLSAFFLKSWKALTKATLDYSELQMKITAKKLSKAIKQDLQSTGAGT